MKIVDIQAVAELLSALAAFVTIGLACIELYTRSNAKKAENAIEIYSEYLFVVQQLEYAVKNIENLEHNCKNLTTKEINAFVQNHKLDISLIHKIQKIENMSIMGYDYTKDEGQMNSQLILEFTGMTVNLINTINTFYTFLTETVENHTDWINKNAIRVYNGFEIASDTIKVTGDLLKQNLKKSHNMSNAYIVLLFTLSAIFLLICFLL